MAGFEQAEERGKTRGQVKPTKVLPGAEIGVRPLVRNTVSVLDRDIGQGQRQRRGARPTLLWRRTDCPWARDTQFLLAPCSRAQRNQVGADAH